MKYDVLLEFWGFTNDVSVTCMFDKSPLEFYARVADKNVLQRQVDLLRLSWPDLDESTFLRDVCSSNLEKCVWINRNRLVERHNIKMVLRNVSFSEFVDLFKRSLLMEIKHIDEANHIFQRVTKYPSLRFDWMPMIRKHCNPGWGGMRKKCLYYLSSAPRITETQERFYKPSD